MLKKLLNNQNIRSNYILFIVITLGFILSINLVYGNTTTKQLSQEIPTTSNEKLAYIYNGNLWIKELSNKEPKQLTNSADVSTPRWSKSGKWIAFRKANSVCIISPIESTIKKVNDGADVCGFAWSPKEDLLAYRTTNGSWFVLDPNTLLTHKIVSDDGDSACEEFYDVYAKSMWSDDGKYFAYVKEKIISQSKTEGIKKVLDTLWKVNVKTAVASKIYQTNHPIFISKWLSKYNYILIWQSLETFPSASLLADGLPLKAISLNKGKPISISEEMLLNPEFISNSANNYLVWVEGGNRETYVNKSISVMNFANKKKFTLTDEKLATISPSLSPNGEYIAFVASEDISTKISKVSGEDYQKVVETAVASRQIWLMTVEGKDKHPITNSEYGDLFPQWSSDSQKLIFVRKTKNGASIYSVNIKDKSLLLLVNELSPLDKDSYYGYTNWTRYFDFYTQ